MALATTCPTCKTSFKVNPDQLKLRKGLVRCGKCQHVFSGIQYLRYVSESRGKRAKKSRPAQASVVAPETVAEDLNTAFFLPETQFAPDTTVRQAEAGQTDAPESESESHSRHPRHSGSPIKSPIEVQASGSEPGIASTVAPVAASDTPNEANTADSSRSRKSRRANRRKNRRRR
ncbi:MAG: MJ0042-type zinc finger domain-containing protein, partial [Burkholderiaceae bacterium]